MKYLFLIRLQKSIKYKRGKGHNKEAMKFLFFSNNELNYSEKRNKNHFNEILKCFKMFF